MAWDLSLPARGRGLKRQSHAGIECMGPSQVPAWTAPGSTYACAIEQLACRRMVSFTGLECDNLRIQIGDHGRCADAQQIRLLHQPTDRQRRIAWRMVKDWRQDPPKTP